MKFRLPSLMFFACCLSLALGVAPAAQAQLGASKVLITFKGTERPVKNVTVTNSAEFPLYVTVKVEKVVDLSVEPMEYEPADGLLVSPKTFSVGPNGERTIRLLLKQIPAEKEQAYRVALLPQAGEFTEQTSTKVQRGDRAIALRIITGAGLLVFSEPSKLVKEISLTRDSAGLTLTNRGNVQVQFSSGVSCPSEVKLSKEEQGIALDYRKNKDLAKLGCVRFEGGRAHSGRSVTIPAPLTHRIIFSRRFGSAGDMDILFIEPNATEASLPG
jgi:P pilus assembly chaperone PapD